MTKIHDHTIIPLSDGTQLSARIWFPDHNDPAPAILEYHPYPKRYVTADRDEIGHGYFAEQGYVSIRVDMRGSGDSGGFLSDEYTELARQDAVEVIEWIANAPWCDGNVGMYGLSWGGYNGIQLATLAPEPLKAIVVAGATDDRFDNDTHFIGGVIASEHIGWAVTLLSFLTRPPDPAIVGDSWKKIWVDRLNALESILPTWLAHPIRDDYWTAGFPRFQPDGLRIPALLAGGVSDVYVNAILRMVSRQPELVQGVIGPWGHHFPHRALPEPDINWLHHATRWFDRWLRQEPNGVENDPPLRLFITEPYVADGRSIGRRDGRWISITPQAIETAEQVSLGLGQNGRLGTSWLDGQIKLNSPATLGTAGGEFMPMGWGIDLPSEQRLDDALSICFETEPLAEAVEVIGKPSLSLNLKIPKGSGFAVARLCDVAPDGSSTRIAIGALELATMGGIREPETFDPNETYSIKIEMGGIAHRFAEGQRIRLALSNAYWPMLWPSNQDDELIVLTGMSELMLPTPSNFTSYDDFAAGDGHQPLPKSELEPPLFERELVRDMPSGRAAYRITDAAPRIKFDDHMIETWNATTRIYQIDEHDPSTASMEIKRDIEVSRGNWKVTTCVEATIVSNKDQYRSDIKLTAKLNGDVVVQREFKSEDARFPKS
ncbi:MAG: CocE/NonD family hydrolase [Chloroflexota bacterium]